MIHIALAFVLSSGSVLAAADRSPVTVRRSSGPLQVELSVLKETRGVKKLWFTLEVRNLGTEPSAFSDRAFFSGSGLRDNTLERRGLRLEVIAPRGKPLRFAPYYPDYEIPESTQPPAGGKPSLELIKLPSGRTLEPLCPDSELVAGRRYCPLDYYLLSEPGTYLIRAVMDRLPSKELVKVLGKDAWEADSVLIITPWVKVRL